MNFYYKFSNVNKWIQVEGDGENPSRCQNIKWTCNKGNTDIKFVQNAISDLHPGYGAVLNYADHPKNLYVIALSFGHLCKYGYIHNANNFIPFQRSLNLSIKKAERIINVKGSSKVKAHKRKIHVSADLERIGDKEKITKGIITTDYKESVKNVNNYISNLNESDEGKEILKSINDYTLLNYENINNYMKNPDADQFKGSGADTIDDLKNSILDIKKFINDAPKFEGEVYRGLQYHGDDSESKQRWDKFINNIENSEEIKFGSFLSTSSEKMVAVNFATSHHQEKNLKSVLITIQCKSGVSIENISQVKSEHEVLMNSDKSYKIIEFKKQDDRNHFLTLREI